MPQRLMSFVLSCILALCLLGLWGVRCAAAQTEAKSPAPAATFLPKPGEVKAPVSTEALDQAGKEMGKRIDVVGKGASRMLGSWVNAQAFWGVTWLKLGICGLLLLLVLVAERVARRFVGRHLAQTCGNGAAARLRLMLQALSRPLSLFIWVYGVYWALSPVLLSISAQPGGTQALKTIAGKVADLGGTVAVFWFLYRLVDVLQAHLRLMIRETGNTLDTMLIPLVRKTLRVVIAVLGGIVLLQSLTGLEVGPLVASLGIGSIAVALAAKDSVANLFGSFTILFSKPFQVGDYIRIDGYDGNVEDVGFRTTRIRTFTGHLVSVPNEKVINTTLENVGKRPFVRWLAPIRLAHDTPSEKVEEALRVMTVVLENHEGMRPELPPRVLLVGFGDGAVTVQALAWYHPPDWNAYQDWVSRTSLAIIQGFHEAGIRLAPPVVPGTGG